MIPTYDVLIRRNDTGEVRRYHVPYPWQEDDEDDGRVRVFYWTEGNFACDCNRAMAWHRAGGDDAVAQDFPCGEGAYSALRAILPDGTEVPLDDD